MPFKSKEPEKDKIIVEEHGERPIENLIPEEPEHPETLEVQSTIVLNEAKHETFLRLAKPRVQKILNSLRILGNCSNKSSYDYTHFEIIKMFNAISNALDKTKEKFLAQPIAKSKLFEF